jgi:hypothetical protein
MSRARSTMHLITDSKEALRAAVVRSSARLSPALEQNRQIHQQTYDRDGGREIAIGYDL